MKQFNTLNSNETTDPSREWNSQPPAVHFKYRTSLYQKLVLWFKLSWGELITMLLIMVMLRFNLQSIHLNLTLNLFQIQIPLRLNKLMMTKWNKSHNSYNHIMMIIFWMLTSRCFSIDYWSLLH